MELTANTERQKRNHERQELHEKESRNFMFSVAWRSGRQIISCLSGISWLVTSWLPVSGSTPPSPRPPASSPCRRPSPHTSSSVPECHPSACRECPPSDRRPSRLARPLYCHRGGR